MKKWMEDNPVGLVLASICGGLVLIGLLLVLFWSMPPPSLDESEVAESSADVLVLPELKESAPIEQYAIIGERPVFNPGRMPILEIDTASEDEEPEIEEVDAPEVTLAGVVITPTLRMVTLKRKDDPESLLAFEGQPLEGNYGSWHVSRIEPREITLSSADGESIDLKLEVHNTTIEPPEKPEPEEAPSDQEANAQTEVANADDGQPMSRAEEIRQRIAERREELKRAAEEQDEQQDEAAQDYRSRIQSMINGRKNRDKDDNQR